MAAAPEALSTHAAAGTLSSEVRAGVQARGCQSSHQLGSTSAKWAADLFLLVLVFNRRRLDSPVFPVVTPPGTVNGLGQAPSQRCGSRGR